MVCKDEQAIREKKSMLLSWIEKDPAYILQKARLQNTATPMSEYLSDLDGILCSTFKRSCHLPEQRSIHRQRVIVRYVAYMQLQLMDGRSSKTLSRSALSAYRNPDTPVEESVDLRLKDGVCRGPPASVSDLLSASNSFFSNDDRARVRITTNTSVVALPVDKTPPVTAIEATLSPNLFESLTVATIEQTRKVHHRLVLRPNLGFDVYLYHHPMEVYIAWGLHEIRHVYENLGPTDMWPPKLDDLSSGKLILSDSCPVERCPSTLMVARPGSTIYDSSFPPSTFAVPIKALFQFVVRRGKADPTRSNGWRLDLSNAGQAFEENNQGHDFVRPKILCGDGVFLEDADGPLVRAVLGRFVDGLCSAGKLMCREMRMPHSLNPKRYNEYALHLQEFLFAKNSYIESVTIQLLNLSRGDHGEEHVDILNDQRSSYDCTIVKVMNLVDSNSHLYSLKIICGFRKRLGDFYSVQMSKIEKLMVNARTMLSEVDASYSRLVSNHRGSHHPAFMPTWSNIDPLYIDDHSPWICRRLTPAISQEGILVLTGIARGIWLSPALSAIYKLSPVLSEAGMLQLLMVMSWQNSFQHFWEICARMNLKEGVGLVEYPVYEYYRVAHKEFYQIDKDKGQEMFGGESPRFGPIGFDFKEVFGTDTSQRREVVDNVVSELMIFLDEVDTLKDRVIDRVVVLDMVLRASERIRGHAMCELGSFRLMILLQGAIYLRVRLTPGRHLRQLFFPVKNSGSWSHLKEMMIDESQIESVCYEIQQVLSTPTRFVSMDEVEVILCESKAGRLLKKFDLIIKGQDLFKLDEDGASWVKLYRQNSWQEVIIRHRQV